MAWAGPAAAQVISLTLGRCLCNLLSKCKTGSSAEQAVSSQQYLETASAGTG